MAKSGSLTAMDPTNLRARAFCPVGEFGAGGQRVWVVRAKDPLAHRQQRRELGAGLGRAPGLPRVVGKVGAGGQRVRMFGAEDPLVHREERSVLVAGPTRISRLPGPEGEVGAGIDTRAGLHRLTASRDA